MSDRKVSGTTTGYLAQNYSYSYTNDEIDRPRVRTLPIQEETTAPWLDAFNEQADETGYLLINAATLGLGGWVLDKLGLTNRIDKESSFFKVGEAVDTAVGLATLRPTKLLKGAWKGMSNAWGGIADIAASTKKAVKVGASATVGKIVAEAKKLTRATLGVASRLDYRRTFFEAYPHLKGKVVVHHAVEQRIINKYPHLISISEMHSLENLRGIPVELNADLHLSQIRRSWDEFYLQYPHPTREQLLRKAGEIDVMFGHLFLPPIN